MRAPLLQLCVLLPPSMRAAFCPLPYLYARRAGRTYYFDRFPMRCVSIRSEYYVGSDPNMTVVLDLKPAVVFVLVVLYAAAG